MIIDLENIDIVTRTEMLELASGSIEQYDGRFTYDGKQYKSRKIAGGLIEIEDIVPKNQQSEKPKADFSKIIATQYKMENWPEDKKQQFKTLTNAAKNSTNPDDRKFVFDGLVFEITETVDGKAKIKVNQRATGSLPV
jgi:hypothetical protein